jgi:hypothetical protein
VFSVRSTLERITGQWRFKRRLPASFGRAPLWVSPSSGLRYLLKPMTAIDPELLGLIQEFVRPGDCVWDVGANVGLFSVAAARIAGRQGRVVAVEPDAWLGPAATAVGGDPGRPICAYNRGTSGGSWRCGPSANFALRSEHARRTS